MFDLAGVFDLAGRLVHVEVIPQFLDARQTKFCAQCDRQTILRKILMNF